jgi:hypothetical protein
MVSGAWLLTLVFIGTSQPAQRNVLLDNVDLIELNHFYDDLGRHAYDQILFYGWSAEFCRYDVIAWYLVEDNDSPVPMRLPGSGGYMVRWYDRDVRRYREIRSRLYCETWTHTDPERENKQLLEEKYRLSLTPGRSSNQSIMR